MKYLALLLLFMSSAVLAQETTTYSYDALGRLITSANTGGPRDSKAVLSSYDDAGNRRTHAVGVPAPVIANATTFSVSTSSSPVTEGAVASFVISRTGTATGPLTVNYGTVAGSAMASSDFTAISGTLTFRPWETVQTVAIQTVADTVSEPAETFSLQLSSPSSGATIGAASAAATIAASGGPGIAPTAVSDAVSVGICEVVTKNVIANDSDSGGSYPLTLVSVTSTAKGTAYVAAANTVSFTAFGVTGSAQVTYTVRNSIGLTSTGILAITITNGQGCN